MPKHWAVDHCFVPKIMTQEGCELCSFKNPKGTATAVILKDNKLLMLKRNEEPFKDIWDLPGGYMNEDELPEETLKRELMEELNCEAELTFIKNVAGYAYWKDKKFPVIVHFFLAELHGEIKLDGENSAYEYKSWDEIGEVAFDTNNKMLVWLKNKFRFDLSRVRKLIGQLDPSAQVDEYSLYKAIIEGHLTTIYDKGELIGMGWIFPRQTLLRKQAVIEDMIVDEKYRGQGYGGKLLDELIGWARNNDVEVVELTTNARRIAANELYKKRGFQLHETNHYLLKL